MDSKNNYIIAEINISKEHINKDIRILNSFEQMKREIQNEIDEDNEDDEDDEDNFIYENEKEIKDNCLIKINEKTIRFSYFYKFQKVGIYKIQYIFNKYLTNTNYLFFECSSIINLDLSNFNTQKVISMYCMFSKCSSLININLSKINTEEVVDMSHMFRNCPSLRSINLSNINTKNVINMSNMFRDCSSLIYLDLSNFNADNLEDMGYMFYGCTSLIKVDWSNFKPNKKYVDMDGMFCECISLTFLINFNIQEIYNENNIFFNCSSLIKKVNKIKITIRKLIPEPPLELYINNTISVLDIKIKYNELTGVPIDNILCTFNGQ